MKILIKTLVTFILTLSSYTAPAQDNCKNNPIYCKILKFKKGADKDWALEFSNKIVRKAKIAKIDPNVALAILLQESMLNNLNTYKVDEKFEKYCDDKDCYKVITTTKKAFDISIAQININTAKHYGLDIERLFRLDEEYALDAFFLILRDKMNMCMSLKQPWSCYHSVTEIHRLKYIELVSRYL